MIPISGLGLTGVIYSTFIILALHILSTDSCGVLVHNEVFRRARYIYRLPSEFDSEADAIARDRFSEYVSSDQQVPVVQAGAFFPDWGYNCLLGNANSEAAHWPPFLKAAVDHIIENYGENPPADSLNSRDTTNDEDREAHKASLIAFIFAVASHATADASWHSIHMGSGFLKALSGIDFNGNIQVAHGVLDTGGDVIYATRYAGINNGAAWVSPTWNVPVGDIVAIYARLGRKVSPISLRYCMMRGMAGLKSVMAVGPSLYPVFAEQSPTMVNELDEYFLGGVQEMASSTAYCWGNLTKWLINGTPNDALGAWDICDLFRAIFERGGSVEGKEPEITEQNRSGWSLSRDERYRSQVSEELGGLTWKEDRFGAVTIEYSARHEEKKRSLLGPSLAGPDSTSADSEAALKPRQVLQFPNDPTYISTYVPYSKFGHAMSGGSISPIAGDNSSYLAVSAALETYDSGLPQKGSVYVISYEQLSSSAATRETSTKLRQNGIRATEPSRVAANEAISLSDIRFGHATTTWKPNRNSIKSYLAISSPGPQQYISKDSTYNYPGGKIEVYDRENVVQEFWLNGADLGGFGVKWWGEVLTAGPLTGDHGQDLVVSSPRSDGSWGDKCPVKDRLKIQQGFVTIIRSTGSREVSSDTKQTTETKARKTPRIMARIFTYERNGGFNTKETRLEGETVEEAMSWEIYPPSPTYPESCKPGIFERFGSSIAISPISNTLFIGSPGLGKVYGYIFDPAIPSPNGGDFRLVTTISSSASSPSQSKFGGNKGLVAGSTSAGNEWVAISSPDETVDGISQAGVVRIYLTSIDSKPIEDGPRLIAEIRDSAPSRFDKFGSALSSSGDPKEGLWIGSAFAEEERGAVWWLGGGELGMVVDAAVRVKKAQVNGEEKEEGEEGGEETQAQAQHSQNIKKKNHGNQKVLMPNLVHDELTTRLAASQDVPPPEHIFLEKLFIGPEAKAHFGSTLYPADLNNDGLEDLVVGIPYQGFGGVDNDSRLTGAVAVYLRGGAS